MCHHIEYTLDAKSELVLLKKHKSLGRVVEKSSSVLVGGSMDLRGKSPLLSVAGAERENIDPGRDHSH